MMEQMQEVADCARYGDLEELTSVLLSIAGIKSLDDNRERIASLLSLPAQGSGNTPLHMASGNGHLSVVQFILPFLSPAQVNAKNAQGSTPLHWAALNGQLEIAKKLLSRGADATIKNDLGRSPLTLAEQQGHLELAQELLKTFDPEESLDDDDDMAEGEETRDLDLKVSLGPNGELCQEFLNPMTEMQR